MPARRGHMLGIHARHWVAHRTYVVHTMAVDARGHRGVAGCQPMAMHAGQVFSILVHTLTRVVLAHEVRTTVAPRAQLWNLGPPRYADESTVRAHGRLGVVRAGIAAVTIGARELLLQVN